MYLDRARSTAALLCLMLFFAAPAAASSPAQQVFDQRGDGGALWGILVFDADANRIVDQLNPDHTFYPSSNIKLFTSYAALVLLGPDYQWATRISFRPGDLGVDGTLRGPLVVTGGGDPTISLRFFPGLEPLAQTAKTLHEYGIRRIEDYILIDDRAFRGDRWAPGWMYDDLPWYFAAPVGAFSVDENQVQVVVTPGAASGDPAQIAVNPPWAFITIDNRTETLEAGQREQLRFNSLSAGNTLLVSGGIPAGSKAVSRRMAVEDPGLFGGGVLTQFIEAAGISVSRPAARIAADSPSVPADSPYWTSVEIVSPPLSQTLEPVNMRSVNFIADQIFLTLGLVQSGAGDWKTGTEALVSTLPGADIDPGALVIIDGSGLSRYALASPRHTVRLLKAARQADFFKAFEDSLPLGGVSGNLSWRYSNSPLSNKIRAKTGTASGQSALSGYFTGANGNLHIFSIYSNNYVGRATGIRVLQDRILESAAGY